MSQNPTTASLPLALRDARFAFIHASWHGEIVAQARESFIGEMGRLGIAASQIDVFALPGAFEIPLHAKVLAQTGRYAGIVASGFVVDGGIYRHDFVASAVIDALMRVQLDSGVPVFSAVLTPHHFHEHEQHQQFYFQHFVKKGQEAALACVQTVTSLQRIAHQAPALSAQAA
ncbi:MAG: 6,7-dimethyl-8-ribityllumazine synthase 2 [Paracidovorax wautersii]|uniref:6,7-dimethyl-8-ribityllumazine synthase n=1 Tax=Paracidovorax wautersii TaxID=1177982 RepID=A0A7V8FLE2_9BURK|nr:MAG: 6,7-dimethyl-8-ribityllumazine synthase 2 [Paracidovorax wautersii]